MKHQDDDLLTEINITPFVDIILVILIIFILVAQVIGPQVFGIKLPKAVHGQTTAHKPITVSLDVKGKIAYNGYSINEKDLALSIKQIIKDDPRTQVIVSADEKVFHGRVVHLLDLLKGLGVSQLAVHVQPQS
ncbi:biopolymer transporter ExbD [Candidatus Desantisbacteria bacterium]|nr:biopolymer transporter ExbD [Candidatus Desantisbacteria bacterium]